MMVRSRSQLSKNKGFSLIELIVCLAIIGILASLVSPMGEVMVRRNKEQELRVELRQIREAIDLYKLSYDQGRIIKVLGASGYPPTLNVLEDGVDNAKSPNGSKIFFLRKIPKDPFAPPTTKAIDSWGLRSYASDPAHPEAGEDVFDVYSKSPGDGLNGVPYRDW